MMLNEKKHYSNLLHQQKNSDKIEKVEPKIEAFTYANELYGEYKIKHMPHSNLHKYILDRTSSESKVKILSLGSGTGDFEIELLEASPKKLQCELIDINKELLKGAKNYAIQHKLDLKTKVADVNKIELKESVYDFVIVRSSLHHFMQLEHICEQVNKSLKKNGDFLVIGEIIGRNGERLYPETERIAQKIFDILPAKFRYNTYTKSTDSEVPDIDHSKDSFESIRSEEILPLLLQFFKPKEYVTFDAFLTLLLDFRYGPNYDIKNPLDKSLVEMIANLDIFYISNSILKPVTLFGIFGKK